MQISFSELKAIKGMQAAQDFAATLVGRVRSTGGTVASTTSGDKSVTRHDGTDTYQEFDIVVQSYGETYQIINNAPAVASISSTGVVTMLTDGWADFDVVTKYGRRNFRRYVQHSVSYAFDEFMSYSAGCVRKHILDQMGAAIAGKTPGDASQRILNNASYSTDVANGASAGAMTRNTSVFSNGVIDISATSIATTGRTDGYYPAHLISPRHVIQAKHIANTGKIVFLDNTNTYRVANVVATDYSVGVDTAISYLDTAITNITPYYFLPANWLTYIPSAGSMIGVPSLPAFTKKPQPNGDYMRLTGINIEPGIHHGLPLAAPFEQWRSEIISGDSGSGLYVPIYDTAQRTVLLDSFFTAAGADNYADHIANIEAVMRALATAQSDNTAYTLNKVDLSGYAAY